MDSHATAVQPKRRRFQLAPRRPYSTILHYQTGPASPVNCAPKPQAIAPLTVTKPSDNAQQQSPNRSPGVSGRGAKVLAAQEVEGLEKSVINALLRLQRPRAPCHLNDLNARLLPARGDVQFFKPS
jgi:hypothetical protein